MSESVSSLILVVSGGLTFKCFKGLSSLSEDDESESASTLLLLLLSDSGLTHFSLCWQTQPRIIYTPVIATIILILKQNLHHHLCRTGHTTLYVFQYICSAPCRILIFRDVLGSGSEPVSGVLLSIKLRAFPHLSGLFGA